MALIGSLDITNKADVDHNHNAEYYTKAEINALLLDKLDTSKISDVAYNTISWNANTDVATKNAIRDKIENILTGGFAFIGAVWIGSPTIITDAGFSLNSNMEWLIIDSNGALSSDINIAFNSVATDGKRIIVFVYRGDSTYDIVLTDEDYGFWVGNADAGAYLPISNTENGKTYVFQFSSHINKWIQLYPDKHII